MLIVPYSVYPKYWSWKHRYGYHFCESIVHTNIEWNRFFDNGGTNLHIKRFPKVVWMTTQLYFISDPMDYKSTIKPYTIENSWVHHYNHNSGTWTIANGRIKGSMFDKAAFDPPIWPLVEIRGSFLSQSSGYGV